LWVIERLAGGLPPWAKASGAASKQMTATTTRFAFFMGVLLQMRLEPLEQPFSASICAVSNKRSAEY
jgi:hypothetical protein